MIDDRHRDARLVDRLLEEDRLGGVRPKDRADMSDGYALLEKLLDHEQANERRVRRVALFTWGTLLLLVPLGGVAFYLSRVRDQFLQEGGRAALLAISILAILALCLAVLTTAVWLFRSRTATLPIIERRLAAMEQLLTQRK